MSFSKGRWRSRNEGSWGQLGKLLCTYVRQGLPSAACHSAFLVDIEFRMCMSFCIDFCSPFCLTTCIVLRWRWQVVGFLYRRSPKKIRTFFAQLYERFSLKHGELSWLCFWPACLQSSVWYVLFNVFDKKLLIIYLESRFLLGWAPISFRTPTSWCRQQDERAGRWTLA